MTEPSISAEIQTALDSLAPIVTWMRENGVKTFANNGMSVDLDDHATIDVLRKQLDAYKALLVKAGLLGPVKSRYAIPDLPNEPTQPEEE